MQHLDQGTIHAWIDGELSPEQVSEIEAHLAGCPECAAMVAEARGLVAASTRILTALDDVPGGVIPSVPDIAPAQIVRRRWYQRTDLRAAAALLFVAGASLLVTRKGTDSAATRAMTATADKGQPAVAGGADTGTAGPAQAAQEVMSDAATMSPVAAAPKAPEPAVSKPLVLKGPSRRAASESNLPGEVDQLAQPKLRFDSPSSRLQARDEAQLSKEEAAKMRAADVANVPASPPLFARVGAAGAAGAAAPLPVAAQAEGRSGSAVAGVVEGRVTEKPSGRVVANASVVVQGTTLGATTDKDGKFRIENVPLGAHRLLVRRIGYQAETVPLAIQGRESAAANVGLTPSPSALSEVVVTSAAVDPPPTAMMEAAINKVVAPLRVLRADSTGGTKRTIYEVSKGVEVILTELPVETTTERDNASDAAARQKVAAPQSSAAPADARQRENALGARASGVVVGRSMQSAAINSISWTERGRKFVLTGRLTTKDLEALKARLMQMRR